MSKPTCSIEGCGRSVRARGWCGAHYMRWSRSGDPEHVQDEAPPRICAMAGCDRLHEARGLCQLHYRRVLIAEDRTPVSFCTIDGCGQPAKAHDWCTKHYQAWWKEGDPTYQREHPIHRTPHEAFAARTEREGDCLVWTGHRHPDGYGYIKADGKSPRGAHRVHWEIEHGPIPPGLVVRHKCDNPPCVRLDHLELGTHQDNMNDMISRGRAHWQKTPETEDQT